MKTFLITLLTKTHAPEPMSTELQAFVAKDDQLRNLLKNQEISPIVNFNYDRYRQEGLAAFIETEYIAAFRAILTKYTGTEFEGKIEFTAEIGRSFAVHARKVPFSTVPNRTRGHGQEVRYRAVFKTHGTSLRLYCDRGAQQLGDYRSRKTLEGKIAQ